MFCAHFPDKVYYPTFEAATRANIGITRKLARRGPLNGRPTPYRCKSFGVEHWHIGRRQPVGRH
jgi:hypothetical protein